MKTSRGHRFVYATLMIVSVLLGAAACTVREDDLTASFDPPASPVHRTPLTTTAQLRGVRTTLSDSDDAATRPAPAAQQQSVDADLARLLVAAGAPPELIAKGSMRLSNGDVAVFFPDREAALDRMALSGRISGVRADYAMRPVAADSSHIHVTFTTDAYRADGFAVDVLADPALAAAVGRFVPNVAELTLDGEPDGVRAFRGTDNENGDRTTYVVQFRKQHLVGSVVVSQPAASDDGGQFALALARHQQEALSPSALLPDAPIWRGTTTASSRVVQGGTP